MADDAPPAAVAGADDAAPPEADDVLLADGTSGADRIAELSAIAAVASTEWGKQVFEEWMKNNNGGKRSRYLVAHTNRGLYDVMVDVFSGNTIGGVIVPIDDFPPLPPGMSALEMRPNAVPTQKFYLARSVLEQAMALEIDNAKQIVILSCGRKSCVTVVPFPPSPAE